MDQQDFFWEDYIEHHQKKDRKLMIQHSKMKSTKKYISVSHYETTKKKN